MVRRKLSFLTALLTLTAGLAALTATGTAQPPADPRPTDLKTQQEQNAELFRKFQKDLLALAQRMERSDRAEDKERAKVLYAALDLARKENLESQFQKLIAAMARGTANVQDLDAIAGQDQQLRKVLQELLTILMTDDEATRLKAEIARLEAFLKEARSIKRNQETIRAMTEGKKGDPNNIAKNQDNLADRTKDLANQMAGKKGDNGQKDGGKKGGGEGGEKGIAKAEPKPETKPGESAGEGRSDTDQEKAEPKPTDGGEGDPMKGGGDAAEARPGAKDGEEGNSGRGNPEPKEGEAGGMPRDSGMPKPGEGQTGGKEGGKDASGQKGGGKEGGKDASGQKGGGKEGGKDASGQKGGGKEGGKEGEKSGQKDAEPQGENKSQGQGKGEDKPSDDQQAGESRGTGSKDGAPKQGSPKGGGQPGEPGDQQGGNQQPQQQPQGDQTPGRKQVQEAYPHQKHAVEDLKKNERKEASKKEDKAIEELAKAIQELEKRLKQLREEEMLKLLANLEARCNRMLGMQIEVYEATKAIDAIVLKNNGQKGTAEIQKSQQQGDKEGEIIVEADRSLKLLESEGSAVAFATVLEEVKQDMIAVQRRLTSAVTDKETQVIEENIISLLKEMVLALKKAQQDIQQQQDQPPPPPGQQRPNQKQLIDLIAELKLIRSLQVQVNSRTKMYGEKYPGEQAGDPLIQAELRQLSARQAKLQDMLNKIASGNNQ